MSKTPAAVFVRRLLGRFFVLSLGIIPGPVTGRTTELRKMTAEDKPYVLDMMRKFYSSDAVMTDGSEEIFVNDIEECLSDSPFLEGFVFPDEDGEIKGYAMIAHSYSTEFGRRCICIEDIYLEEEMRGRGAASEFFDHLRTRYPDSVNRLEVETENERAIASYRRNGFEEIPYHGMIRLNSTKDEEDIDTDLHAAGDGTAGILRRERNQ
jgi:GNAT superfamily N-acetyltransferase